MDVKLLGHALQYHGVDLLHSFKEEQHEELSPAILSYVDKRQPQDQEIRDQEFHKNICAFIGRKSDLLFRPLLEEEKVVKGSDESIDDSFAIMPPLEVFMDVSEHERREHFYKSLKQDDCVTGVVTSILDNGLRIHLLSVNKGCARDIEDLNIAAFCPAKELPKLYAGESALDAFQEKDIVRGIVLSVIPEAERIILSLREKTVPDTSSYPRIGLISEDEFPVSFRRKSQVQGMGYNEMMHSILGFNNQGNVRALMFQLNIQDTSSYLRCHARLKIPEKEYAEGLRKWQSQKLAHQSVAQGVEKFKEGQYLEAMQHFNRALQIDDHNVEALVARGALYANKENFNHAIQDFEEALTVNPKHNNARNYLIETLLTVGKMYEDRKQLEEACGHYMRVLKLDPDHIEAKEMLMGCQRLMNIEISPSIMLEEKRKVTGSDSEASNGATKGRVDETDLSKTAEKLKQLIQEDKKGKQSQKKKKKHNRRHSRDAKQKKRGKRSLSNSSSRSVSSEDSSSTSSSSSRDRRHKKSRQKSHRESGGDGCGKQSQGRRSVSADSSPVDKKLRKEEEKVKKSNTREQREAVPDFPGTEKKSISPVTTNTKDDHAFAQSVQASAVMSFLPVSSFDFFGQSAIPGLGSPPSAGQLLTDISRKTSIDAEGRNVESERDRGTTQVLRRNDLLMAEREKFYKENRERYKRFRGRSQSKSSSSRSSSLSSSPRKKSKGIRWSRSSNSPRRSIVNRDQRRSRSSKSPIRRSSRRSRDSRSPRKSRDNRSPRRSRVSRSPREKSQMKHSPVITGVKELDMYLGGAKKAFKDIHPDDRYNTWESFIGHALPVTKSSRSRSGNSEAFSKSPKSTKSKSSRDTVNQFQLRKTLINSAEKESKPDYIEGDRKGKFSQRSEKITNRRAEIKADLAQSKDKKGKHRSDMLSNKKSSDLRAGSSLHVKEQKSTADADERQKISSKNRGETAADEAKFLPRHVSKDTEISNFSRSCGKFHPHADKGIVSSNEKFIDKDKVECHGDPHTSHKLEELSENVQSQEKYSSKSSKQPARAEPKLDFMPRVLRVPKMDDPTLSKPLMSSNELAALERQKKEPKNRESPAGSGENNNSGNVAEKDNYGRGKSKSRERTRIEDENKRGTGENESSDNIDGNTFNTGLIKSPPETDGAHTSDSTVTEINIKKEEMFLQDQKLDEEEDNKMEEVKNDDFVAHAEDKKWLGTDEIEKEIERRVQQRLQEEEAKLQAVVEREVKVIRRSRWDDEDTDKSNPVTVNYIYASKSKALYDGMHDSEKTKNSRSGVLVTEKNRGWSNDFHGNKYFADCGLSLSVGWHKDRFGNPYCVRDDSESSQDTCHTEFSQRNDAQEAKDKSVRATSWTFVSSSRIKNSYNRTEPRSLDHKGDRKNDSDRIQPGDEETSRDRIGGQRSPHSQDLLESHRGRSQGKEEWSHGSKPGSQSRSQSRSRSRSRNNSNRDRRSRSRSQSTEEMSLSDSKQDSAQSKLSSGCKTKNGDGSSHRDSHPSEKVQFAKRPASKWDSQSTSRWDVDGSTKGDALDKVTLEEGSQIKQASLTELEKFLIDLKQQKKKQWIAEGKLKEKD